MPVEVNEDNITKLRSEASSALKEINDQIDSRDLQRLQSNDVYVGLFLQWNKDIESAVKMICKTFKWRKEFGVNDLTVQSLGEEVFKKGFFFLLGKAIDGTKVLHFRTANIEKKDREINMRLAAFWFERIQQAQMGEKVTIIMDTTGSRLMNADTGFSNFIIECCACYFPGMMKRMIIYNLPTLLTAFWKLISKMLSAEQREVTAVCGKNDIFKYIDKDNLTVEMGGIIKFQYSFPPFPDDLPSPQ